VDSGLDHEIRGSREGDRPRGARRDEATSPSTFDLVRQATYLPNYSRLDGDPRRLDLLYFLSLRF
jgi:hypothetical protein